MCGRLIIDAFANEVHSGRAIGPYIYSVGPLTDGSPPNWEGSGTVGSTASKPRKPRARTADGLHRHQGLQSTFKRSLRGHRCGGQTARIPVVGHVPTAVGLSGAIAARSDSIEHLNGFWQALQSDNSAGQKKSPSELLEQADLKKLPALVQAIKAADVWNCPTLALHFVAQTDAS